MPQIAQLAATYASQIFWMLVIFALIYFGIGKAMLPRIGATVELRDKRISDDLAAASAARGAADATEEAWRTRMDAARADAQKATADAKAVAAADAAVRVRAADAELGARSTAAEAQIKAAAAEALAGIDKVAAEAAQEIVARVSGASVDRKAAERAVKAALARA